MTGVWVLSHWGSESGLGLHQGLVAFPYLLRVMCRAFSCVGTLCLQLWSTVLAARRNDLLHARLE